MRLRHLISILVLLLLIPSQGIRSESGKKKRKEEISALKALNSQLQTRLDSSDALLKESLRKIDSLSEVLSAIKSANGAVGEDLDYEVNDSLFLMWYIDRGQSFSKDYDGQTVEIFSNDVSDEELKERLRRINTRISIPYNSIVRKYCLQYCGKMQYFIRDLIEKSQYFDPVFEEIFDSYGVPVELKHLAVIESNLRSDLTSKAGAKGIWQIMYIAAKHYGLKVDSFVDERIDVLKSTDAAARILRDSYNIFGDWSLAMASYNCGVGTVRRAIARSGGSKDFWKIYNFLPAETRNYVPAFIGLLYATTYYKEYGIEPSKHLTPIPVDTIHVHNNLSFKSLSTILGVPYDYLKSLNPQYLQDFIPGKDNSFILMLPVEYGQAFINFEDSLYNDSAKFIYSAADRSKSVSENKSIKITDNRTVYVVKSGDLLGRIAIRYGVTVADIRRWNGLKSDKIKVGQRLTIYTHKSKR